MRKPLALLAVAVAVVIAGQAAADWDPSQPAKWAQLPDLNTTGIDVNASHPYILADDFECTQNGPITDIHIWGSWHNDYVDPNPTFVLSFHKDIPESLSPTGYSMPGPVEWIMMFGPGMYTARRYAENIDEGWMTPPDDYQFPGDHVCWQYNFFIDEADAFWQQGTPDEPMVYWLDVQVFPSEPGVQFGWKTSLDHWNDDAVWGQGEEPYPGPWYELIYPPPHEMAGLSIDLAFVITGPSTVELDWGDAPDPTYPTLGGSNGARHVIVAGTLMGAGIDGEPNGQPDPNALGDDNDGFDDEDGVIFTSPIVPGMGATVDVVTSIAGFIDAWIDFGQDGNWTPVSDRIAAGLWTPGGLFTITYTVPATAVPGQTFARFRFNTSGPLPFVGPAQDGEVEDYEVTIEEEYSFKWIQRPDLMTTGIDVNGTEQFVLADDFFCEMPGWITDIYVWASWLNDYLPWNQDPRAVDFTVSFHEDIPAWVNPDGYSIPGDVLWVWHYPAAAYEVQIWADSLAEGWMDPPDNYTWPGDHICWLYHFQVPISEAFHQVGRPDSGIVYWLDVQARPHDPDAFWGWKTSVEHWNDDAVWGWGLEPYYGPWYELRYPPQHEYYGESIDLAFAL
ncbi:MAG: GEVED domain-containing protein, partial [Candidatus Eisenbacteria bacterium]